MDNSQTECIKTCLNPPSENRSRNMGFPVPLGVVVFPHRELDCGNRSAKNRSGINRGCFKKCICRSIFLSTSLAMALDMGAGAFRMQHVDGVIPAGTETVVASF